MAINIKDELEEESTYYFICENGINPLESCKVTEYYKKNCDRITETLKSKIKDKLVRDLEQYSYKNDSKFRKMMHEHKIKIAYAMIDYIKNDIIKFLHRDNDFVQKTLLCAKKELTTNYVDVPILQNIHDRKPFRNTVCIEKDTSKSKDTTEIVPKIEFLLDPQNKFYNVNNFIQVLLNPEITLTLKILEVEYAQLFEDIHDIFISLLSAKLALQKENTIYIQVNKITSSKIDSNKIFDCIAETYKKDFDDISENKQAKKSKKKQRCSIQ